MSHSLCQLSLIRQTSSGGTCQRRSSGVREFGCRGTSSSAIVWVRSGCRGVFMCNGLRLTCGSQQGLCLCNPPTPPPPPPPLPSRPLKRQALGLFRKLRAYLVRVYPEETLPTDLAGLQRLFDSLDLFYARKTGKAYLRKQCSIPYVPAPGAFFMAPKAVPQRCDKELTAGANFYRHSHPIVLLHTSQQGCFESGITARFGPQPSWTPHTALVRYIFYPAGFCRNATFSATRKSALNDTCTVFDLRGSQHVSAVFRLRKGDLLEITQYGGWLTPSRGSRVKGLWANLWRGSGVFMRLGTPLASMCKMGAIIDMIEALHQRDALAIGGLVELLSASEAVSRAHVQFPSATLADALARHCLLQCPCMRTVAWTDKPPAGFPALMARWLSYIQGLAPSSAVVAFLSLTYPTEANPFSARLTAELLPVKSPRDLLKSRVAFVPTLI